MAQEDLLEPMLRDSLKKELLPVVLEGTTVAFAGLGNDAGLIGALYNFLAREKKKVDNTCNILYNITVSL